jgi:glycerophosphoryl diester phosphodiesterase
MGSMPRPIVIAHRGASAYAPENTLAAFGLALKMNVDAIELDVHMSRDGEIVVIHDSTVERTTGAKGSVGHMSLAELKALDAGTWFNRLVPEQARREYLCQRIPTLAEVMVLVGRRARLFVEIKDPELYPANLESELVAAVRKYGMESQVTYLSFSRRSLRKLHALAPHIRFGLLVSRGLIDPVRSARALDAGALALRHQLLKPGIAAQAHSQGLSVVAWTVNKRADIRRVIDAHVDGIITNYPDQIVAAMSAD